MATAIVPRLFRSTDTGAPSFTITAGSLITLLDDILVNGYNGQSVSGIVRVGSTATVTFASAHGFAADGLTIVRHAGAAQSEYNGDFQISNVTDLTYDVEVTGTPTTPATGSITAVVAPVDWTKAFTGTNRAIYRPPLGNRLYVRVNDNNPNSDSYKSATMQGIEIATGIDTGFTGIFPDTTQMGGLGVIVNKGNNTTGTRNWVAVCDGYELHLFIASNSSYPNIYRQFHFFEPASEMSSDPYGVMIIGDSAVSISSPNSLSSAHTINSSTSFASQAGHYFAREYSQVGGSVAGGKHGNYGVGSGYIGMGLVAHPSPQNNATYVSPIMLYGGASLYRAQFKAAWQPLHTTPLGHGNYLPAASSPIGRRLFAIATAYSGGAQGETFYDIDGPWR